MKKSLVALLATLMVLSLCACGGSTTSTPSGTGSNSQSSAPAASAGNAATSANSTTEVEWPTGPITLVVPAKAGGGTDVYARIAADYFERATGQPLVIMNMPDGAGSVGYEEVRNAKPDGQTLMWYHTSLFVSYYTHTYNYSPIDSFTPIVSMSKSDGNCIVVPASSPYQTLDDLVNAAKETPETIIAGIQTGSQAQFMFELLQSDGDCKFKCVDAGTDAERVTALLGGQVDVTIFSATNAATYEESGDIRVLAITGEERSKFYPDWPTAIEQGYERVTLTFHNVIYGPLNMDPALVEKINKVFAGIMDDADANQKYNDIGCTLKCYDVAGTYDVVKGQNETMKTIADLLGY